MQKKTRSSSGRVQIEFGSSSDQVRIKFGSSLSQVWDESVFLCLSDSILTVTYGLGTICIEFTDIFLKCV